MLAAGCIVRAAVRQNYVEDDKEIGLYSLSHVAQSHILAAHPPGLSRRNSFHLREATVMSIRNFLSIKHYLNPDRQAPVSVYFELLYSDYRMIKSSITDQEAKDFIETLPDKNTNHKLSWNDVYYFELILAKFQPIEKLRSKIRKLRSDLRNVAGPQEYAEYEASKPPDLQSPPDPNAHETSKQDYEKMLREDLKDLLSRLYLRYAILPVREEQMKGLTQYAAGLCLISLILLLFIVAYLFLHKAGDPFYRLALDSEKISSLTIFSVVVTGAMGGFVSALQRIQSPPTEGDTLYNLSLLFYGSYSVFVAPITGAIFAIVIYLMFTSGILQGSFFPTIYTPPAALQTAVPESAPSLPETTSPSTDNSSTTSPSTAPASTTPAVTQSPSPSPTASPGPLRRRGARAQSHALGTAAFLLQSSPTPAPVLSTSPATPLPSPSTSPIPSPTAKPSPSAKPSPAVSPSPSFSPSPSPSPTATPSPTPKPVPKQSLTITEFLAKSGPAGGSDYALLIIWCFIAGFAERFVPDALDRLISSDAARGGRRS